MELNLDDVAAQTKEKIEPYLNALPEPALVVNYQGTYLNCLGGSDSTKHHDLHTLIGKTHHDVLPHDVADSLSEAICLSIDEHRLVEHQYAINPADLKHVDHSTGPQHIQYFTASISPVSGKKQAIYTVTNITAHKQMMAKIERQAKELERLTVIDHLTQCYNRYALDKLLPEKLHQACQLGRSVTIVMVDLDKFKQLNDEYGHLYGDLVLKLISECLMKFCMNVYRYGGDEFLLYLEQYQLAEVEELAKAIIEAVQEEGIRHQTPTDLSVTLGVTHIQALRKGQDIESVVAMADQALYQAKHAQRGTFHIL
ncbi:sensor domain-containing diguanylate cyclase [Vibrio aquaticus]|uniref:diguanylate cyclase n=1 Tax=Vibrio aquaticus TaxID=2496559 RepID=A0A432CXE4_9VIBR|nr:sensor domain-containing diguanylate cyclase [Vibrio aquaticus]RTZ16589.1 sensor domain-containing diguanylate cyclase [Vibrio aquaticus]